MRIAFYPSHIKHTNPYFDLYHQALEAHGIHVVPGSVDDAFLRANAERLDAFHVQWCPESIWRQRGETTLARLRGIVGLYRFLRLNRALGSKLLWTVHDLEHHEGADWIDRIGYRILSRFTDLTISHSRWCTDQATRAFKLSPSAVVTIPHGNYDGVYPEPRTASVVRAEWGVPDGVKLLLCFGFIRPYKGADVAAAAMDHLPSGFHLLIAGPPTDPAFIADLRRRALDRRDIQIHDTTLTDQQVADLIAASDCVLFPYRKITGSGALAAALTLGRGVVVSDLPYFRETLEPIPEAGEFFAAGDADALAAAIRRFSSVPSSKRHDATRRLADLYAWDKAVEPLIPRLLALQRATPSR